MGGPEPIPKRRVMPDPQSAEVWDSIVLDDALKNRLLRSVALALRLRGSLPFKTTVHHRIALPHDPLVTGKTTLARGLTFHLVPFRTLNRSRGVPAGSVARGLEPRNRLGPALKAVDAGLEGERDLNAVPGGADSTDGWVFHLPPVGALDSSIAAAADQAQHLSVDQSPKSAATSSAVNDPREPLIDFGAFHQMEESR